MVKKRVFILKVTVVMGAGWQLWGQMACGPGSLKLRGWLGSEAGWRFFLGETETKFQTSRQDRQADRQKSLIKNTIEWLEQRVTNRSRQQSGDELMSGSR